MTPMAPVDRLVDCSNRRRQGHRLGEAPSQAGRNHTMFERFTERARQVVVLAQEEARTLKHNYIGTEHILLGLLREEEGLAARVLESLDITVERVRAQVVRIVGSGEEVTSGQIPFTPRAKKVLELALREALSLGHNYIGTEHILLGLVRENEGVAARILLDFDADSEKIRNEVIRMLSGPGGRRQGGSQGAGSGAGGAQGEGKKSSKLLDQVGRDRRRDPGSAQPRGGPGRRGAGRALPGRTRHAPREPAAGRRRGRPLRAVTRGTARSRRVPGIRNTPGPPRKISLRRPRGLA